MARQGLATDDALEDALAALRRRDYAAHELDERLESRGFSDAERAHVLETLLRTGLLDDERYAEARASALAGRGAGDAFIRHALGSSGIAGEIADHALESLEPELQRARRIVARRGTGPRTARYLSGKGFTEDAVRAVAAESGDELG